MPANDCAAILHDPERALRRLGAALEAVAELDRYRELLLQVQALAPSDAARCPGLAATVTGRAYAAETAGRILLKHALDSLNDMRDGGWLYAEFGSFAAGFAGPDGGDAWFERVRQDAGAARQRFGESAGRLLEQAANARQALGLSFVFEQDTLVVRQRDLDPDGVRIATLQQTGQAGRMSPEQLFQGARLAGFARPLTVPAPSDCHHRPVLVPRQGVRPVDLYAAALGGIVASKDMLYQQARRNDELGPRGLRGEDPVTAILVAIAVIGAALVVYGIATDDRQLAEFGAVLLVGAALAAFPGYVLVLGVAA